MMYNTSLNLIGDNCGFTKKEIVKKRKQLLLKHFKKIYYIGYLIYLLLLYYADNFPTFIRRTVTITPNTTI
jgi:hypothetical protein